LKRSPDTATADEMRLFQLHLTETGVSICNRNRILTGLLSIFAPNIHRKPDKPQISQYKPTFPGQGVCSCPNLQLSISSTPGMPLFWAIRFSRK
jgi:hypothetical protein